MITSDHEEKRAEAQVTLFTAHSDNAEFHRSSAVLNYSNNSLFSTCAIGFYDWKFNVPNFVRADHGGRSPTWILGSNPARGTDVCLL